MKPLECASKLRNPDLLNDLTFPKDREAVTWASELLFDLHDLELAAELVIERPHDELRVRLLSDCLEKMKARAAA